MPLPLQDTLNITEYFPAADTVAAPGDSIPAAVADTLPVEIWDAAAVYGPGSVRIAAETAAGNAAALGPLAGNNWFQMLTLVVLALYCWMIYWYRGQATMCLKGIVNFKTEDKFNAEHGHLYNRFVNYAVIVTAAAAGIMIVKGLSAAAGGRLTDGVPGWLIPPAAVMIAALLLGIVMLQFGILKLAGGLTLSEELTEELIQAKKLHLAAAAILVVPPVLLYTGLNPAWDSVLKYIIVTEIVVIAAAFVLKSLILFVRQKVSLLVWILYLCAVEIFPLSFIVLMAVRNV